MGLLLVVAAAVGSVVFVFSDSGAQDSAGALVGTLVAHIGTPSSPWHLTPRAEVPQAFADFGSDGLHTATHERPSYSRLDAAGAELLGEQLQRDLLGVPTAGVLLAHAGGLGEHHLIVIHRG